jgi:polyisoprenoid-binding protein YceI
VPKESAEKGTVYHTTPGAARQISFLSGGKITSDGHSSSVIGYAVAGPTDNPAALKAGMWAMPVKSLKTGNKLKDTHIADATWLDAAAHPDVVFVLKEVKDIKPHKESASGRSFTATLVGDLTMHGVTKPLTIPDTVLGFVPASEKAPFKGDLLAIRCKYTVKFSDYGVSNTYTTGAMQSVADDVAIDQSLILSTVPPEQQPEPKPEAKPDGKPEGK